MTKTSNLIALDVGERRIGVASANSAVKIAIPTTTLQVDGSEIEKIAEIVVRENASTIIVGYPRNQSGDPTAQTEYVENFAKQLEDIAEIKFQDESLTSVMAEQRLTAQGRPFAKEDIDMHAAVIILQDYLEAHGGS